MYYSWSPTSLEQAKCILVHSLPPNAPCIWEMDWNLLYFSYICPYRCGIPADKEMGRQKLSLVHRISAAQFSSREHCIAWFIFFLTALCCSKSIFPPHHHISVRGGKRKQKKKKRNKQTRQPLWFCNRMAPPQVNVSAWSPTLLFVPKVIFYIPAMGHAPEGSADWPQARRPAAWQEGAKQCPAVMMAVVE